MNSVLFTRQQRILVAILWGLTWALSSVVMDHITAKPPPPLSETQAVFRVTAADTMLDWSSQAAPPGNGP